MDVSKLNDLGWKAKIDLYEGIKKVYSEIQNTTWAK
jgi:GDP-L-fucose synthase